MCSRLVLARTRVDTRNNKRSGARKLVPWLTVKGGRPWGRPPLPVPFTY
jgi:hypothetical protein